MELAYHDLRRLAQRHLSGTRWMSTLNTTSLINESYLRLVSPASRHVESRDHFFALASRIMRHVVCDYAKSRIRASKRIDRDSEAETALAQSRFEHLNAKVDARLARIRLEHALGHDVK